MDPQGYVDVADTSTATGSATYPPGMSVYDADGEKLGTVSDRQDKDDFLLVHKGWLFGHDASIPRAVIERTDSDGVHLRVRKDELKGMNQTPMPEPTAPIRHRTDATEAVAADQPPTVPIAPPVPVPDMGAAAAAASAFSHEATPTTAPANEPASASPAQSAVGAAQDAAGHAVEVAQAGVGQAADAVREQVGPLFDTLHERVEPIAEQIKEQASAVAQQQMASAADGLERTAGLVTAVGDQLRERQLGELARYSDLTVDQMKQAAEWLRTTTPEEIARNVEDLAKKQPELVIAGAAALGLLGLRLLRRTSHDGDKTKDEQ
jgi:hypothetical protein